MEKGDIILVPFPFTDFSGNRNRPAIVLAQTNLDLTVAFVSTQLKWKEATDVAMMPNKTNGLKKESIIRLSKIATIDKKLALGSIGKLSAQDLGQVNQNLKIIFNLE
jgi:mRNA interferase MazF